MCLKNAINWICLPSVLLWTLAVQASPNFFGQTPKILPLGDSITSGDYTHISYRRDLWFLFDNAGLTVDYVGSNFVNSFSNASLLDFDLDHEGHYAWTTDGVNDELGQWLQGYTPDIALIHLGTNDVDQGQPVAGIIAELSTTISLLRADNPNMLILLAKIIPMRNVDVSSYNSAVATLALALDSEASPIVLVDHAENYDPFILNHDKWHPNSAGEAEMAQRWFTALEPFFEEVAGDTAQYSVPIGGLSAPLLLGMFIFMQTVRRPKKIN
jgi:hypothetical protein